MGNYLGDIIKGKIIPRSYASIKHLPGSKMINDEDRLLGKQEISLFCERRRSSSDIVIVTEKVDGMNVSVLKKDDKLYPLSRKGYDVRTNDKEWIKLFAKFVEINEDRFMDMLENNQRCCGEWMIKTHTIQYKLPHEPFIPFDIIDLDSNRLRYVEFRNLVEFYNFTPAGLIHIGESISPDIVISLMGRGYHGAINGIPEGIVYKYENLDGYVCSGKFVSHPDVGNEEIFNSNMDNNIYNILKRKHRIYLQNSAI